ncbi:hypothetical protein ID866_5563 [Astraeus odoratus]|nr:hypothetical protein ID866_5563 [Astraeus odoratus]
MTADCWANLINGRYRRANQTPIPCIDDCSRYDLAPDDVEVIPRIFDFTRKAPLTNLRSGYLTSLRPDAAKGQVFMPYMEMKGPRLVGKPSPELGHPGDVYILEPPQVGYFKGLEDWNKLDRGSVFPHPFLHAHCIGIVFKENVVVWTQLVRLSKPLATKRHPPPEPTSDSQSPVKRPRTSPTTPAPRLPLQQTPPAVVPTRAHSSVPDGVISNRTTSQDKGVSGGIFGEEEGSVMTPRDAISKDPPANPAMQDMHQLTGVGNKDCLRGSELRDPPKKAPQSGQTFPDESADLRKPLLHAQEQCSQLKEHEEAEVKNVRKCAEVEEELHRAKDSLQKSRENEENLRKERDDLAVKLDQTNTDLLNERHQRFKLQEQISRLESKLKKMSAAPRSGDVANKPVPAGLDHLLESLPPEVTGTLFPFLNTVSTVFSDACRKVEAEREKVERANARYQTEKDAHTETVKNGEERLLQVTQERDAALETSKTSQHDLIILRQHLGRLAMPNFLPST